MFRRSPINKKDWFRHSWQNRVQTALLLVFLGSYLFLVGWLVWGSAMTVWLLVLTTIMLLLAPAQSPHLFMKLSGARPLSRRQNQELYNLTDGLSQVAGLERSPELYLLPTRQPNALASGSRHEPVIAVSDGLLQLLNRREMAGVIAHEISHLRNDDICVMRLADLAARLTGSLSLFGQVLLLLNLPLVLFSGESINWGLVLLLVFAPQVSSLAQLGLSRVREFSADLGAAELTGDPHGLASALQKIERSVGGFMQRFLRNYRMLPDWLRTHPPTRERIRRLLELADHASTSVAKAAHATAWQLKPWPDIVVRGLQPKAIPIVIYPSGLNQRRAIRRKW
ncbi:heat shock protein HtpX [Malonomonas rubra DSM 5091]|uniref:Heat shock protein HtpX n=1 Tax=Malonomonas rubra DSM 5091 TaxID=1122189 RepID=A0A1M6H424_MALRU|nr:zinc metalloprotease HtpX [Malonomonas rubra]SHJ16955.1 heat shock protein HtpX [Malonomonas rubra DSM 5091]